MKEADKEPKQLSLDQMLKELREEYWKSVSEAREEEAREGVELFTFWLGEERYGIDLIYCRHLLKVPKIVRLPQIPEHILGVFNLRGEIVPALDLRRLFGMKISPPSENSRLLVVEVKEIMIALFLDWIDDIIFMELKELQPISGKETGVPAQYLKGYFPPASEGERMLIYLDLEQLLASEKLIES